MESLAFRLLVASGWDSFRPYDRNVFHKLYLTKDCLEESLACAEMVRRLGERKYAGRLHRSIRSELKKYLRAVIPLLPPGYAEGTRYIHETPYRRGLHRLQSQVREVAVRPGTPPEHWSIAPNMITSLMNISDEIYIILSENASPLFPPTWLKPRVTASSRQVIDVLVRCYGYRKTSGGKGSHVKLVKRNARSIIVPANRSEVSPGALKEAISAVCGSGLTDLRKFLDCELEKGA